MDNNSGGINLEQRTYEPENGNQIYNNPLTPDSNDVKRNYNIPNFKNSNDEKFRKVMIIIGIFILLAGIIIGSMFLGKVIFKEEEDSYITTNFHRYSFQVPETYQVDNNYLYDFLLIMDKDNTWNFNLMILEEKYDTIIEFKEKLVTQIENQGYDVNKVDFKKIGQFNWLYYEVSKNDLNTIICFTEAPNNKVFQGYAFNRKNNIDIKILDEISTVLSSAKYNATGNDIRPNPVYKAFDFTQDLSDEEVPAASNE